MLQLHLQVQVFDKNDKLKTSKAWVSKSFVKNWLTLLYANLQQSAEDISPVDLGGTSRTLTQQLSNMIYCPMNSGAGRVFGYYDPSVGNYGYEAGILVGTGTAANSATTYQLGTQVAHGVSSNQLEYMGGALDASVTVDGSDSYFDIERIFRNSSGGTITIKEYGISVLAGMNSNYTYPFLIIRDVFTESEDWVDVDDGEYLKVTYRLLVTV